MMEIIKPRRINTGPMPDHRPNHRNGSVFKKYERFIFSSVDLSIIHSKKKQPPTIARVFIYILPYYLYGIIKNNIVSF